MYITNNFLICSLSHLSLPAIPEQVELSPLNCCGNCESVAMFGFPCSECGTPSCPTAPTGSWWQVTFILDISKCLKHTVLSFLFCKKKNMELDQMIPYVPFSSALFRFCDSEHRRDPLGRKALSASSNRVWHVGGSWVVFLHVRSAGWVSVTVCYQERFLPGPFPGLEVERDSGPVSPQSKALQKQKATSINSRISVSWREGTRSR